MMHTHANAASVLEIARQLAVELHPHKASVSSITLDSSLERDLGLDSSRTHGTVAAAGARFAGALTGTVAGECGNTAGFAPGHTRSRGAFHRATHQAGPAPGSCGHSYNPDARPRRSLRC